LRDHPINNTEIDNNHGGIRMTDRTPEPYPGNTWVTPPEQSAGEERPGHAAARSGQRRLISAASLAVVSALAGGAIGFAVARGTSHGATVASGASNVASSAPAAPSAAGGVLPGAGGQPGAGGGGHGMDLQGTLTAVGRSTVTVKSAKGTATYSVTGATEIIRNGAHATLAQLKAGDPALVQVMTVGGKQQVGRIFAGKA
jgi:hypothetical protein